MSVPSAHDLRKLAHQAVQISRATIPETLTMSSWLIIEGQILQALRAATKATETTN